MASVGTTAKAVFAGWLVAFLLGAAVAYFFARPYLCDVKVNHSGKPTKCYVTKT